MFRFLFPLAVLCFLASPVWAQEPAADAKQDSPTAAEKLTTDPNSQANIRAYINGELGRIRPIAKSDDAKAVKEYDKVLEFLATIKPDDEAAKKLLESGVEYVERSRRILTLVGQDAESLEAAKIVAWVNGTPLTDADLKGKVVFLDFWAVWCGPCIATFPHLREWQEKYGEKGLTIVGLTRYYDYKWNDDTQKPQRATGGVTPEEEQEMLKKFATFHSLKHRFAIQGEDSTLSEFFGVTGIPHVAVIDQQNKVRLMRVGSGPANAEAISKLLAELLPEAVAGKPAKAEK